MADYPFLNPRVPSINETLAALGRVYLLIGDLAYEDDGVTMTKPGWYTFMAQMCLEFPDYNFSTTYEEYLAAKPDWNRWPDD